MDITHHPGEAGLELRLTGRLDATWADFVSDTLDAAIQAGAHQLVLNFSRVEYISSLGIGVLMTHYKRLRAINGTLVVSQPSRMTLAVLKASGISKYLLAGELQPDAAPAEPARVVSRGHATYELYPQPATRPLDCAAVGRPEKLGSTGFEAADCRPLTFGQGTFGLGLGAFGEDFADCRDRFGEFLAAGGCAIALPTSDAQARPDFVVEEGGLVPCVDTLYALAGSGDFPLMVRFDAAAEGPGTVPLSALTDALLDLADGEAVAFVVLAEAAGLVGATLRRSPAAGPMPTTLPDVRDWLSFTTERTSERSLALLVGVATRTTMAGADSFLRPVTSGSTLRAHVHAAQFPYRPVQRGALPFGRTIPELLGASSPTTVMHLMADVRPFDGVGESDLLRGACWVGALHSIAAD